MFKDERTVLGFDEFRPRVFPVPWPDLAHRRKGDGRIESIRRKDEEVAGGRDGKMGGGGGGTHSIEDVPSHYTLSSVLVWMRPREEVRGRKRGGGKAKSRRRTSGNEKEGRGGEGEAMKKC